MLDKSIEYKRIVMKLSSKSYTFKEPRLPDGYSFKFYEKGDAEAWAKIEASVLEFDSETSALEYFNKAFMPLEDEVFDRCIFISDPFGNAVATATAWYGDYKHGHNARLHWVAVMPEFQSLGLGRAIVMQALNVLIDKENGYDVLLDTQTWSHKAVKLYHSLGFNMVKTSNLICKIKFNGNGKVNEYKQALKVLGTVLDEKTLQDLKRTSVKA